jgi:hypothetical protein
MNTEENFNRIISEMQQKQMVRENSDSLYAALIFCKWHLEKTNWSSEEFRLESVDMALRLCDVVLDRCNGVER